MEIKNSCVIYTYAVDKLNLSHNQASKLLKTFPNMFPDSKIAQKMKMDRGKLSLITNNMGQYSADSLN